ncbi:MAG: hypothetical protein FWE12_01535 [Oscillospiraceae bacterium]|nr:hypothetical protein [Oscillospiraceae bacterium]
MPDYEKMYKTLFNAMTNAILEMQDAQCETEEIFMDSPEMPPLIVLPVRSDEDVE